MKADAITIQAHQESVYSPPVPSVLPEHLWMVPYRRNGFFTGRETLLTALHTSFTKDHTAVLTQGQAINGLGGIGKTQIAVEYAYRHRDEYRFVLWASAATHETLISAFVSIADGLQLPERTLQEQDKIVAAVQRWFSTHEEWLLIVDNADELAIVWPLLPTGSKGHVLVTTRDQTTGDLESFLIEKMDHIEGTLLLLRRAKILKPGGELEQASPADLQVAEQIVTEMDGLPLALDQAGAYIEETGCHLTKYLERYQVQHANLLKRRGRNSSNYPASVATTWSLSFKRVEQNAAAADLLRLCAFLAPDAIPEEIIIKGASYLGEHLQGVVEDEGLLDEALGILRAYSLIRRDATEKALSIHRLVQIVIRDTLAESETKRWAECTVLAVNEACLDVEFAFRQQWERYLPHVQACADLVEQRDLMFPEAAVLLHDAGYYLYLHDRYAEAEPLLVRALAIREQALGPQHPTVVESLNNLGRIYYNQDKLELAEPLYERALAISEQALGPQHPYTVWSLNKLAVLNHRQGKLELAERLYERALAISEQTLEPWDADTIASLYNLAALYNLQGKYNEAESLHQRALTAIQTAISEQELEPPHPYLVECLHSLATLYSYQGKYNEAESLQQRAITISEQVWGFCNPHTVSMLHSLASLYNDQGKYNEAESLYKRILAINEQASEPRHSSTAMCFHGLATLYNRQGKYNEAESLYQRALTIGEQVWGLQDPNTAPMLHSLASFYDDQGKYNEAEPLYKRILALYEKVLGSQYPGTQQARRNYAKLLRAMGRDEEAKQLAEGNDN